MQSEVEKLVAALKSRASTRNAGITVAETDFETVGYYSAGDSKLDREAASLIETLCRERDELEALFDLQHSADMRAVKRWRDANPGNDLVLPDHADMVVWLLERTAEIREALRPFAAFLPKAEAFVEKAAVTPGHSPIMPAIKDFRVADFRRAARALAGEDVQG